MPQKIMAKQIIDANKAAFDNSFNAMVMLQEQSEKMTSSFLEQATWMPDEGKKVIRDWMDACKKGREEYKKMMDEGFQNVAKFWNSFEIK